MSRRGFLIWAAAALLCSSVPARGQETPQVPDPAARIDAIFAAYASNDSPGCAVGVVKDGKLVLGRAYGQADLEHGAPLSTTSAFYLASESKQFTAASVLIAAEEGALSLDEDVRDYIPELPDYGVTITLRHLLHHTSGVRDYGTLWLMSGDALADVHTAEGTLALLAAQRALNFPPGRHYSYTNSGYFLLGVALERATGASLAEFAHDRLFAPLGMESTRFLDDRYRLVANRAEGHTRRPGGGFGRFAGNNEVVGARGLFSTVEDLARWERAFHDRALGQELVGRLLTPGRLKDGTILPYAAGLVIGDFDGLQTVSHGGEGDGSTAFLLRFPEMRLSVICLCNLEGGGAAGLAWRTAVTYLYGPYREETLGLQSPSGPPEFVELSDETLRQRTGAYRDPHTRAVWRISMVDGGLGLRRGDGGFTLRPVSEKEFRSPPQGPAILARFEGSSLRLEFEGQPPSSFEKVELATPSEISLDEYAGEYFSEELGVTWTLEARDGKLRFADPEALEEPLEPTVHDEFSVGGDLRVSFSRDPTGRVVSMSAHTDRVWDLRFDRR